MAKILNKDPITYERERDGFIVELRHFHDTRGTPFRKVPKINGHEIDLYLLYVLVTAHGGWVKVNARNEWESLVDQFNLPKCCVNSGVGLKQIYLRYLDRYEKVHYLGEDGERGSDDDDESRHKRWSARALHSVPLTYNYHQHNVAEGLRAYNGLSADLFKSSDYDRLALSLIAPLPNEQDFAVNVCMLLSNEGKHTLRLDKCPRLVDLLLAHAGVFNHVSLRQLFHEIYGKVRNHSMHQFWYDTLQDDLTDLTNEKLFPAKRLRLRHVSVIDPATSKSETEPPSADVEMDVDDIAMCRPAEMFEEGEDGLLSETRPRLKIEPSDYELFCVGRSFGTQDYLGQRVLQIATILRNLSFSEENLGLLAKNVTFLRFLLLCVGSRWNTLHQLGLDMLGNIATEVLVADPSYDRLTQCLLGSVCRGISSQDRSIVVACLEILNKLSQKDENEEVMLKYIEQQVYDQICKFLTLHDIMLLIQTLECLYSLSSLGERACNCIVRVHGCIDTLVALVTVEAQSYGPKACILMRVVETAASGTTIAANPQPTTTTLQSVPQAAMIANPTVNTPQPPRQLAPAQPQKPIAIASMPVPSNKSSGLSVPSVAVATPVSVSQQQQHAQQQVAQENEQFALSWLRAACELSSGSRIEQGELYRQYLAACSRIGRRGVIAPLHFPRCVRSVFGGSVGPSLQKNGPGVDNLPHYEGIKVRAHQASRGKTPSTEGADRLQPSSPILKAQLSAPPKPTKSGASDKAGQVDAHPHLTQALLGEGVKETPSSLIKSLLASKVNTAVPSDHSMTSMVPVQCAVDNQQVTQRQQRLLLQQQQLKKDPPVPIANISPKKVPIKPVDNKTKFSRVNGAKVAIPQMDSPAKEPHLDNGPVSDVAPVVGNGNVSQRGRCDPPVPPLAPLSSGPHQRTEVEDSDSTGNNSLASSTGVRINVSTDDGENSLTSFEGILLNGIPAGDEDSKDSRVGKTLASKSMMLADLLEKKVDRKDHPILNGVLGKELRIGDKGLELVENHLDKVLKETANIQFKTINDACETRTVIQSTNNVVLCEETVISAPPEEVTNDDTRNTLKRPAEDDQETSESKRQHIETNGQTEEETGGASAAAANLYAAFAASALEDETDLEIPEQQLVRQTYVTDPNLIMASGTRQMFVSQPQSQVLITPAGQITLHAAPTNAKNVVQSSGRGQMVQGQVVLTQGSSGQLILSQAPQAHYMVAQQQVQGHQTVLVTQTQQQQGTGAKTLIIFQNQPGGSNSHQKVMVTPQGQPVMVTQVPRPILQSPPLQIPALVPTAAKHTSQPALTQSVASPAINVKTITAPPSPALSPVPKALVPVRPAPARTPSTETAEVPNGVAPPVDTSAQLNNQAKQPVIDPSAFLCEWRGCMRSFKSANEVYMHACESHCPSGSQEIQCLWERCDAMKRKRFSLMTHLYDRHCNADVLKMMAVRRKQLSLSGRSEIPPPAPPPPHPGYAPNAAFHAIKRHALEFVNPKELMRPAKPGPPASAPMARSPPEQDDNEGPVTKSIRLTSALILRNLVIYSTNGRRFLRSYEPHLASIALSNVESSRTIAQVLYDMNQQAGGR